MHLLRGLAFVGMLFGAGSAFAAEKVDGGKQLASKSR
jgi:hypothetical protein